MIPRLAFALLVAAAIPSHAADPVLAQNATTTVTKSDFDAELARFPAEQHYEFLSSRERIAKMVENILVNKTLAAQAREQGIDKGAEMDAELRNQTERILARKRIEAFDRDLKLPDIEKRAAEIYKTDPDRFREKATYETAHILINLSCRTREQALARAEKVFAEVVSGKLSFADGAAQYSDDEGSNKKGGLLDAVPLERLAGEFSETVRKLKPGEVAPPVGTPFGYHVVKLVSVKPGRMPPYDEVKKTLVPELTQAYVKEQREGLVGKIRADSSLKINVEALDSLKTEIKVAPGAKRPG